MNKDNNQSFIKFLSLSLLFCFFFDALFIFSGIAQNIINLSFSLPISHLLLASLFIDIGLILVSLRFKNKLWFFLVLLINSGLRSFFDLSYSNAGQIILRGVTLLFILFLAAESSRLKRFLKHGVVAVFLLSYIFSGAHKVMGDDYFNGHALYRILASYSWNIYFHNYFIGLNRYVFVVIGYLIVIIEIACPFLFLVVKAKRFIFLVFIGLHIFIFLFMNLHLFSIIMISLNLAFYKYFSKVELVES